MGKRAPKGKKKSPTFSSEDEERRFWAEHDTADYFDWDKAVQPTLPALKPSTTSISLRLPVAMLEDLKVLANKQDVPYQSLMKVYLAERIGRERTKKAS
jgi:predicted DNA binding CopG/RHH family protein